MKQKRYLAPAICFAVLLYSGSVLRAAEPPKGSITIDRIADIKIPDRAAMVS